MAQNSTLTTILLDQVAIVSLDYQPPVTAATAADHAAQASVDAAQTSLNDDRAQLSTAAANLSRTTSRLEGDVARLHVATARYQAAQAQVQTDRSQLRAIAIDLYTGGPGGTAGGPSISSTPATPAAQQEALFGQTEAYVVASTTVAALDADSLVAAQRARLFESAKSVVADDRHEVATDRSILNGGVALIDRDSAVLQSAQSEQAGTRARLDAAVYAQQSAVAAIEGSSGGGGLSIMGPSALTPAQLATWFVQSGYVDFTAASIQDLATWYVDEGAQEDVRGDVAFAQAVLETGGFSSSDAVGLNNYAGIGHCDNCSQGWSFPSPQAGVLGQVQLLRIFASPGNLPAQPPPVLGALTAGDEPSHDCCGTWESLTGVWATDPGYGAKILSIYEQMLSSGLSNQVAAAH